MRKIGIIAALAAALTGSGAYAADILGQGVSTKDGSGFGGPVAVNWGGVYIGGSIGYGNANHNLSLHDFWKDYCDQALYNWAGGAPGGDGKKVFTPAVAENGQNPHESDPQKDWSRFYGHTEENIARCAAPVATAPLATHGSHSVSPVGIEPGGSREIASLDGVNSAGLVGDGRIGFDAQRGRFVFGVFGAYGFNQMEADAAINLPNPFGDNIVGSASIDKGEEWSIGARAGILVNPRTLAYILAAYTQTDYEFGIAGGGSSGSREITFDGVTVGGGVEFAVTNNVFFGIEGTHTFYGKETIFSEYDADNNTGLRLDDELGETKVMGTLKIKLNTGLGGVID